MSKKTLLQFFLLLLALTVFFFIFFYLKSNQVSEKKLTFSEEKKVSNNLENTDSTLEDSNQFSNILEKLSYENYDLEGNRYVVSASKGSIKNFNSNIIYMEDVIATIYLKNFDTLIISSDNAILNNITFNSKFSNNVQLTYLDHKFNSKYLELNFDKNLISMNDSVIYKNLDTNLIADTILIDLISKDSKIFMNDNNKKIKIFN